MTLDPKKKKKKASSDMHSVYDEASSYIYVCVHVHTHFSARVGVSSTFKYLSSS